MTIKPGDRLPAVEFTVTTAEGPQKMSTDVLFAGRKVVLFGLPGAFTPTCNMNHLPGFLLAHDDIKAQGVDTIACTAVNDIFVMKAWGKATEIGRQDPDAGRRQRRLRQGDGAGPGPDGRRHGPPLPSAIRCSSRMAW